jgi:hypothetical protein
LPEWSSDKYVRIGETYSRSPVGDVLLQRGTPVSVIQSGEDEYLVTDRFYNVVWSVTPGREPEVFAGLLDPGLLGTAAEPQGGYRDTSCAEALFKDPWGIAPFLSGWLVSDTSNHALRYIADGKVQTAAGGGLPGQADGRGTRALFNKPTGLAADRAGGVYIADTLNNLIRRLDRDGSVTTAAGTGKTGNTDGAALSAEFNGPTGLAFHNGALYIADTGNHRVRKLEDGIVSTVAGVNFVEQEPDFFNGEAVDGPLSIAKFSSPMGVAVGFDASLLVTDSSGGAIRRIAGGEVTTVARADPEFGDVAPVSPAGLLALGSGLLACDAFSGIVYRPFPPLMDVTYADPFIREVSFCYWRGVLRETEEAKFEPQSPLTWEAAAAALARTYAAEHADKEISGMTDAEGLAWALENGVADAPGGEAGLNVTVEGFCLMLHRLAVLDGEDNGKRVLLEKNVSYGLRDAYSWALANGVADADAYPLDYVTRAQAAVMLYNFSRNK